jgi:hypothetical protein
LIKDDVLTREALRSRQSNYYILEEVVAKAERLPIPRKSVQAARPTILTFADDAPWYNWAHPCRYMLHDAATGELYSEIPAQLPPFAGERDTPKSFSLFHQSLAFAASDLRYRRFERPYYVRPRWKGNRYALLFSGMSNNRHTNDLEFLYRTLRDVYQVPKANIIVLNHDGTLNYDGDPKPVQTWPGDNTAYRMPVDGEGSKADLLGALDSLKSRLKPDDSLLIHTNNHGGHNGTESDLCCYPNWDSLGVAAFTDKLAELPKFRCLMVMMEQCHSGGFNNQVINKSTAGSTSIASACLELNNSIGGADFDPFARDWIAAMTGLDPYGNALVSDPDTNSNGQVSAREAFDYADSIHHSYDSPIFNQKNGGSGCWLGEDLIRPFRVPELQRLNIWKFWPEPDPPILERRVKTVLPQIEQVIREFEPRIARLQQEYETRVSEILTKAGSIG